jgi:hypothetical protein
VAELELAAPQSLKRNSEPFSSKMCVWDKTLPPNPNPMEDKMGKREKEGRVFWLWYEVDGYGER